MTFKDKSLLISESFSKTSNPINGITFKNKAIINDSII